MDWFLYDNGLRHERFKQTSNFHQFEVLEIPSSHIVFIISGDSFEKDTCDRSYILIADVAMFEVIIRTMRHFFVLILNGGDLIFTSLKLLKLHHSFFIPIKYSHFRPQFNLLYDSVFFHMPTEVLNLWQDFRLQKILGSHQ